MNVLVIDNYDSFVYNLAQYLGSLGAKTIVVRNDVSVGHLKDLEPDAIVISPGPGRPEDAGVCVEAIQTFSGQVPILGVCLGHQAIGIAFGAKVVRARRVMHGKTSSVFHDSTGILTGLPNPFEATRYHSLVIDPATLPDEVEVTARTDDGVVMAVRHVEGSISGVQFHPESVLTASGMQLVENFLESVAD